MATQTLDYEDLMRPMGRVLTYNPGKRLAPKVNGEIFDLPASSERYVDCLKALGKERTYRKEHGDEAWEELAKLPPGVRPVTDMLVLFKDSPKRSSVNAKHLAETRLSVREVLGYLLGDDLKSGQVGLQGVRVLFGDHRDKIVVADADSTYRKSLQAFALRAIASHKAQQEKERAAGMPISPPSEALLELYRVDAEMKRGGSGPVCDVCSWPTKDTEDLAKHREEFHAITAPLDLKAPTAEVEIEPARRVRPRKDPAMENPDA